ncbi:MAG: hypothetical protein JSR91_00485 [Proteobacteria bacterium]|nr:hypothetical protein [Pseudomonadota bacterium]
MDLATLLLQLLMVGCLTWPIPDDPVTQGGIAAQAGEYSTTAVSGLTQFYAILLRAEAVKRHPQHGLDF